MAAIDEAFGLAHGERAASGDVVADGRGARDGFAVRRRPR